MFDSKNKISSQKVTKMIISLKEKYDYIVIDTSSECFFDYTKDIIKSSDINIFLVEANLSEIKKSENLLNMYLK